MVRGVPIVVLCILAAIAYGLIHDQITIRICPEYFTVLHPQILPEDTSLTILALAWGVIATWWVGGILGIIVALASRVGSRPELGFRDLAPAVIILLAVMAAGAATTGVVGYFLSVRHIIRLDPWVARTVPQEPESIIMAVWFTHNASYAIGFIGGIVVAIWAWRRRGKLQGPS